jgi:hypothetical protein
VEPERRFFATAAMFAVVAAVGCLVWGLAQTGGMRHYNGFFYYGLIYFALLPAVALAARAGETHWRPVFTVVAGVAAVLVGLYAFRLRPGFDAESGLPIRGGVRRLLARDTDARPKLLVFAPDAWQVAAAVGLELTRENGEFYVPSEWAYIFQRPHDVARLGGHVPDKTEIWQLVPAAESEVPITAEWGITRSVGHRDVPK